jgi:hypothetical protein
LPHSHVVPDEYGTVIPAEAGIHKRDLQPVRHCQRLWIPACAGMTVSSFTYAFFSRSGFPMRFARDDIRFDLELFPLPWNHLSSLLCRIF